MENIIHYGMEVPIDLVKLTGGLPEEFTKVSDWHVGLLKQYIYLNQTDSIFELGCGVGRDAINLTNFLTTGTYHGIDVIKPSIDWCELNIASRFPSFKFTHFDIKDNLHNPEGMVTCENLAIPISDSSIDKVFLFSVFTHLYANEIGYYLKEFYRILKPGGMIYANIFLVNDLILSKSRLCSQTRWNLNFEYKIGDGCFVNDAEMPRGAMGYNRFVIDNLISESGLHKIRDPLTGAWSGYYTDPEEGQDVLLLIKK
jgi:SAM-dependent methyltransferase